MYFSAPDINIHLVIMLALLVCSLNCSEGFIIDDNCQACSLSNICLADNPCQNSAICVLQAPPDNYTCDCSGTNYIGDNCTGISAPDVNIHLVIMLLVCSLNCSEGFIIDDNCQACSLSNICLADNPCKNGGDCYLLDSPNDYICDCTNTSYYGANCTGTHTI